MAPKTCFQTAKELQQKIHVKWDPMADPGPTGEIISYSWASEHLDKLPGWAKVFGWKWKSLGSHFLSVALGTPIRKSQMNTNDPMWHWCCHPVIKFFHVMSLLHCPVSTMHNFWRSHLHAEQLQNVNVLVYIGEPSKSNHAAKEWRKWRYIALVLSLTLTFPPPGAWQTLSKDPTLDCALKFILWDSIFISPPPRKHIHP